MSKMKTTLKKSATSQKGVEDGLERVKIRQTSQGLTMPEVGPSQKPLRFQDGRVGVLNIASHLGSERTLNFLNPNF